MKNKKQGKKTGTGGILKAILAVILVAAMVFGGLVLARTLTQGNKEEESKNDTNTAEYYSTENENGGENSNLDAKEEMEKQEQNRTSVEVDENGLNKASVTLYYARVNDDGTIEAMGEVNNLVEIEGNCTYTFTNGARTVSESSEVVPNASNTICGRVSLDRSRFSAGTWKVSLRYESSSSAGTSPTIDLVIK